MQSRFVAVPVALILLCASAVAAQAQHLGDADGRYSGGQTAKRYEFFGGMSYVCLLYTNPSPRDISGSRFQSYALK
jgi:hypothetical protein